VLDVGLDLGTQSLKAVVCEALAVLGRRAVGYPTQYPGPGCAEQDPRAWDAALGPAARLWISSESRRTRSDSR
jgi:sugar (pentulose or hexulose) kinase